MSADARPIRVAGRGDLVGGATLLHGVKAAETTIALGPIRAFEAGPEQFRMLLLRMSIRQRLAEISPPRRPARRRSRAAG